MGEINYKLVINRGLQKPPCSCANTGSENQIYVVAGNG